MKKIKFITIMFIVLAFSYSCGSQKQLKEDVGKILKENPDVLTDAIKANPGKFMIALQQAAKDAQSEMGKLREQEEKQKTEGYYKNPLKPVIRNDDSIRGTKGAPLVLVEYSDFECPFCARSFGTVLSLLKKYDGKIQFIYKHLTLSFHKNGQIAARYYEGLRLQKEDYAYKFHDEIYKNQAKLKKGEGYLKQVAKKLGANMTKLKKDIKSKKVLDRIAEDEKEAAKFGFQGTPGFLLNGVPVKGAYPLSHFESIISELKKRGNIKID